jgi:hypothetical protein
MENPTTSGRILRWRIGLLLLLAWLVAGARTASLGAEGDVDAQFEERIIQLEALWQAGWIEDYYDLAESLSGEIADRSSDEDISRAAARLLDSLVAREIDAPFQEKEIQRLATVLTEEHENRRSSEQPVKLEVVNRDLVLMRPLASHLYSNPRASAEQRRANVLVLARYLGSVRREIIRDYPFHPSSLNVMPPILPQEARGQPIYSGMDPKALRDPVARAKYEEAILKNLILKLTDLRQRALRTAETVFDLVIADMLRLFQPEDLGTKFFLDCVEAGEFSAEERAELERKVLAKATR